MLQVQPEALLATGAGVLGVGAQQAAVTAAAMPMVSALIPSGVDEVSVLAATAFSAQGVEFSAMSAEGSAMLTMAGEGITAVGAAYEAGDAAGASLIV